MSKAKRIPSLDGLRAVSILLVVLSHSFGQIKTYIDLGNLGVRVFFIISSYLIAGILYRDVAKNRFSLKTFYYKRLMRTFPAFYFYLGVLVVILFASNHFEWSQFWRAPVYLENYHSRTTWSQNQWFVGHTWSLAVEEQFYLLIAILFSFYYRKSISYKKLIYVLVAVVCLVPIIRITYMFIPGIPQVLKGSMHRSFETVADALAIGALMALFKERIFKSKLLPAFKWLLLPLVLLILFIQFLNSSYAVELVGYASRFGFNSIGILIMNISIGILIMYGITANEKSIFYRFLNLKPLVFIGLLSYSIYLWQQVWLFKWPIPLYMKWMGIVATSLFSYYLIEEPFLSLRDKYLKRRVS